MKKITLALILLLTVFTGLNVNAQRPYSIQGFKVFEWDVAPGAKQEKPIKVPVAGTLELKSLVLNDPDWQGTFVLEDLEGKMICVRVLNRNQTAYCEVAEDGIYYATVYNPATNISNAIGYASMQ